MLKYYTKPNKQGNNMKKSERSALRHRVVTALAIIASAGAAVPAQAAYVMNATEIGGDVVFAGSGSIDLRSTTFQGNNAGVTAVNASKSVGAGPTAFRDIYEFTDLAGPTTIGPGTFRTGSTDGTGEYTQIFFDAAFQVIIVPAGYNSTAPLAGQSVYAGQDFESLGLAPGAYNWTWGSGPTEDTLTLNVGAVPIPAALWLFGSGLLGLVGMARRKKSA
jgi:hypothetical protein